MSCRRFVRRESLIGAMSQKQFKASVIVDVGDDGTHNGSLGLGSIAEVELAFGRWADFAFVGHSD